ncbi:ferredoxin-like [Solanum stenotomum]|uniref:ferredoxin-like n=1 Tax=Solanum stenotomum TaxID=172797 RepID=UPI0020D16FC1|nr:ferredoxin-like [Solanum stenotomum]
MANIPCTIVNTCFFPRKSVVTSLKAIPNVGEALFGLKSGTSGRITCKATTYKVKLITPKGRFEFNCPHNVNILDRALETGLDLPFTCKAGSCSSCVGKIIAGTVDQSENSYLDDEEIKKGYVLTCVAYPKSNVTIHTNKEKELG